MTTLLMMAAIALADGPGEARLWSFDKLAGAIGAADAPTIVDVRPRETYAQDHIPGAVWFDMKAAETLAAKPDGLRDKEGWAALIAPLGLGKGDVVVYGDDRQLSAARTWWLLTYLGVPNVGLLDGNYSLWKTSGKPTTSDPSIAKPTLFPVQFRTDRLATREDVKKVLSTGDSTIVDARSRGEHVGSEKRSKNAGRIPSACHVEWKDLVDNDGRFLDLKPLRERFEAAKVAKDRPVVAHCQGGGRASVDSFVTERLGYATRNYYLGWSDWGNAEDVPVETGPRRD